MKTLYENRAFLYTYFWDFPQVSADVSELFQSFSTFLTRENLTVDLLGDTK